MTKKFKEMDSLCKEVIHTVYILLLVYRTVQKLGRTVAEIFNQFKKQYSVENHHMTQGFHCY